MEAMSDLLTMAQNIPMRHLIVLGIFGLFFHSIPKGGLNLDFGKVQIKPPNEKEDKEKTIESGDNTDDGDK